MKYRKKAVEIEAVQWMGFNESEIKDFVGKDVTIEVVRDSTNGEPNWIECTIHTLEGDMRARVGDYIIKGVKGEFYPCKPDIFEATYYSVDTPLDRMEAEIAGLVDKFHKLDMFMKTDKFLSLPADIVGLLEIQYGAMMAYNHALQLRASKMRENKE